MALAAHRLLAGCPLAKLISEIVRHLRGQARSGPVVEMVEGVVLADQGDLAPASSCAVILCDSLAMDVSAH